ncbi:MarR family winged helix-turn-helix transcriptional regulator [Micromonospora sp. URMC 106]|uniref:MarR family winged helix-turn-helix transcriptional regulator n=1 Tax=Micromonospora sp. URMC 106 TaxID=3423408 RepID=UPI003F1D7EE4
MTLTTAAAARATRWQELNRLHATVSRRLEQALRAGHELTPPEYEILAVVARSDSGCLRMQRAAELVGLPQSTTSRLVARLESAGLLERYLCDTDRRGVYTQITQAGRDVQAAAAATYDEVLREVL